MIDCLGCLITADGSRDELIRPQRLPRTYHKQLSRDGTPPAACAVQPTVGEPIGGTGLGSTKVGELIIVALDEPEEDDR